ncbi:MAG: hypothetical protein VKS61_10375 [Candidatus Sericytochromatia bacterium]|nr:hypothetical protein [Candidatus Sericytochromatia bacterium]
MPIKLLKALMACTLAGSLSGCFQVTHNLDVMASTDLAAPRPAVRAFRTELKTNHLAWGLINPGDTIVRDVIAREVKLAGGKGVRHVRLTRQVGVVDGLVNFVTFGIFHPWTLIIEGEVVR